jgi:protein TonB
MSSDSQAVTAADRLGLTLFLAAAAHGLIILGVGFAPLAQAPRASQALDVVLVQQETEQAPDEAEYLANADAAGGGEQSQPSRPRAPVSSSEPVPNPGLAPAPLEAGAPEPTEPKREPVLTQRAAEREVKTDEQAPQQDRPDQPEQSQEIDYEARMAQLAAEVDNAVSEYADRPRKQFVTARTRESAAAGYMHDWVQKVERVGNLNYPAAAKQHGLSGALVLVVGIKPDGSLKEVRVRASSGSSVLDTAAQRIVRLAAPFEPFPDELREQTDILYITRTWRFDAGRVNTEATG